MWEKEMPTKQLAKFVRGMDELSDFISRIIKYLVFVLILVLFYEVAARYIFNSPTIWAMETSAMVFGSFGVLCWGYVLKIGGHVRVDIFYTKFSPRMKALVDTVMTVLLLIPIEVILVYTGFRRALFALKVNERMVESSWLPPSAPFRFVLAIGFTLFLLQTLAELTKNIYFLVAGEPLVDDFGTMDKENLI